MDMDPYHVSHHIYICIYIYIHTQSIWLNAIHAWHLLHAFICKYANWLTTCWLVNHNVALLNFTYNYMQRGKSHFQKYTTTIYPWYGFVQVHFTHSLQRYTSIGSIITGSATLKERDECIASIIKNYRKIFYIRRIKSPNLNVYRIVSRSCLCQIPWSQVLSREWRCS